MIRHVKIAALACALAMPSLPGAAFAQGVDGNDFPTIARADYIFGCMGSNGQSRPVMERCACSIDHIARLLPYEEYVKAETILRTVQVGGEKVAAFRSSARHKRIISDLRRAQAEADILCF